MAELTGKRRTGARLVALLLAAVLFGHGYAVLAASVTARTPADLEHLPAGDVVEKYASPMFRQDWMVFAPTPGNADIMLRIQARFDDGAESGWFDLTDADIERSIRHRVVPSRMYLTNFKLAVNYRTSLKSMERDMQSVVARDFMGEQWIQELQQELLLAQDHSDPAAIRKHLAHERAATALATAIARSQLSPEAEAEAARLDAVRIRIVTIPVAPYGKRNNPGYRSQVTVLSPGWREPVETPGMDLDVLEDMYGETEER